MVKALKNIERYLCDLTSVRSVHTASAGDQQVCYDMHTTGYFNDLCTCTQLRSASSSPGVRTWEHRISVPSHKCKPDLLIFLNL